MSVWILVITLSYSIIGMVIDRNLLLKFIVCYESFLLVFLLKILLSSTNVFTLIIVLLVLFNSVFESVLGVLVVDKQADIIVEDYVHSLY